MGSLCGKPVQDEKTPPPNGTEEQGPAVKLLLLGSGDSGKSTIFRQMKIQHGQFKDNERAKYVPVIRGNILKGIKALVKASIAFGVSIEDEENRDSAERFLELEEPKMGTAWEEMEEKGMNVTEKLQKLWNDKGIQTILERRSDFQLDDCIIYYLTRLSEIGKPNYVPTLDDVVKSRTKTTGIVEVEFKLGSQMVKLVDVGGQRNERKKWIKCFENVNVLIYVVAISEFDQVCYEDDVTNRMEESLKLFATTVNGHLFDNTQIVLFFNKVDLFKEKIQRKNITVAFPEYTGGQNFEKACEYIKAKYLETTSKQIPVVYTCATNNEELASAFEVVTKTLKH